MVASCILDYNIFVEGMRIDHLCGAHIALELTFCCSFKTNDPPAHDMILARAALKLLDLAKERDVSRGVASRASARGC